MNTAKLLSSFIGFFLLPPLFVNSLIYPALFANVTAINMNGPYLGLVVPDKFELGPLLEGGSFTPNTDFPTVDISGRRFHVGEVENCKVIAVMTGLAMLNAGITTQLLLTFFSINGVVVYGIAGNANDELNIGDITIPRYWAHTGLWSWQRFGQGADDKLALEENGDYTREIGYLPIGDYNVNAESNSLNYLNNIWFQPEEVFPVTGTPEIREHHFWVPVDENYYEIATQLANKVLDLEYCINDTTCLSSRPRVVMVPRGVSSSMFLDNAAYRDFLNQKFEASPVDMESAGVALTCLINNVSFIAFQALSDLAGGSNASNEASIFYNLASKNAVIVLTEFIKLTAASNREDMCWWSIPPV